MPNTLNQHLAILPTEKKLFCLKDKQESHKKCYSLLLSNSTEKNITNTKPQLTSDKEWVNSVYVYNKSTVKPLVAADVITEKLVKSYFNFDLPHKLPADEKIRNTRLRNVAKRLSLNKMLPSKAEIKHLNDKGVMTVFLYNRNSKVTNYKIKKKFSLVHKSNERVRNKGGNRVSLMTVKQNRKTFRTEQAKNVYLKTRLARVNKIKKTRFFLTYIAKEKKQHKRLFLTMKKNKKQFLLTRKRKSINLFKYPQLKLYKLNLFLFTKNKAKQNEQFKSFISAKSRFYNKKKVYKAKQNRHLKPYLDARKKYKKYYKLKQILFLISAKKVNSLIINTMKLNKNLNKNKLIVTLYMLKIISFEKVIKLFSIIRRIGKSRRLNIDRKKEILRLIRSNLIKKYNVYNSLLCSQIQNDNDNKDAVSYSNGLDIIQKHRKIKISNIYRKKQLYLYYSQKLAFNNNKLKNWFMLGIKSLLSKIYNKKIELNIVNLKYLYLNSHNLVEAISTKLMNRKNRLLKVLKKTLRAVTLPSQQVYFYQQKELTANNNRTGGFDIDNIVLSGIEHRDVNGVRIEASGRLTKRITASRSVFKVKYKGSLRDPETMSSLGQGNKKKSSGVLVGHRKANVQYSNAKSKTIIGSFGLKVLVSSFNTSPVNHATNSSLNIYK